MKGIKKLYVYGDSFVYGDNLPQDLTWPNLLGKSLKIKCFNRGISGGSNKLSVFRLFEDIHNDNFKDALVIFAWTGIHRDCYYDELAGQWYSLLPSYRNRQRVKKMIEEVYWNFMHTDLEATLNNFLQCILIQSFLGSKGVPYAFINSFRDAEGAEQITPDSCKKIEESLDKKRFLLGFENSIRREICLNRSLLGSDNFHPSLEGHIMASVLIKEDLESKLESIFGELK